MMLLVVVTLVIQNFKEGRADEEGCEGVQPTRAEDATVM